ncbi:MAG: hypothetical protein ACP6IY_19290 [Promethearchaeia archaeon]
MKIKRKNENLEDEIKNINNFIETGAIKRINNVFRIEKWSLESKTLFYLGLFGLILLSLTFIILPYFLIWFYVYFVIILSGFIFSKKDPEAKINYNFSLVIIILAILAFIPSNWGQVTLSILNIKQQTDVGSAGNFAVKDPFDFTNTYKRLQDLQRNPFTNIGKYVSDFMDVVNYIVFFFMVAYGLSSVTDVVKGDAGAAAKKGASLALAIAIMTIIYAVLGGGGVKVRTVWQTMGKAWTELLKKAGLAEMDQSCNTITNATTIINGLYRWTPLITIIGCFTFAYSFRKTDLKSVLFARDIIKEDAITVQRTNYSMPVLIITIITIIFVTGYFLITATPQLIIDPVITLVFYISAMAILPLLGMRIIIINKSQQFVPFIKNTFIWTILGLMGLFLWFQIFQPAMFNLNLLDYPSGLLTLAQGIDDSTLTSPLIYHLFLVALPETLIFQIAIPGIGNRIYFQIRKGSLMEREKERLLKKREILQNKLANIPINNSITRSNLRNLAKRAVLQKQIDQINLQLEGTEKIKLPYSYFVIPTLLAGLFGSFIFSDYHRFRRGISFQQWWQNPMLGLTYMGAGYFLTLIAFFSWPAAILVHWLNNIIALIMAGGA